MISLAAVLTLHVSAQVGLLGETPLAVPALVQSEVVVAGKVDLESEGRAELPPAIPELAQQNLPRLPTVLKQDTQLVKLWELHSVSDTEHLL